MRTHFKNLATAVVLYIVVLAKSCSKENIVISPTKDKGGGPQLMQHKFASPAKALQGDDSILDDGTAMETADDYSEEEQQDNPDTVLQKNNNLLRRRKPNNRGSSLSSHSSKNPNSGQGSKQSLLELPLLELLKNKLKEIEQLKQKESEIWTGFNMRYKKIKICLDLQKSLALAVAGSCTKGDIKNLYQEVQNRKEELKKVIIKGDKILEEVKKLKMQRNQSKSDTKAGAIQNKVQAYNAILKSYVEQYCGLERQLQWIASEEGR
ncbi:hypothetical protein [Candidatus Cardinium hertigii]|uniref:Uncharacterized protein n=1 Tax=Candidatus Cardinium hertigii TaxID=247481 RepID=A0A2Z3L9Q6_9BACT|nr:hypothetical protein [Candidatus Cardinium hertigii]AWN82253.1 hypothetical protein DK880_00956 [Candidatus Cardinium hertigii]